MNCLWIRSPLLVGAVICLLGLTGCATRTGPGPDKVVVDASSAAATQVSGAGSSRSGLFRVHRLNSKKQMIRQRFTRNSDRPGCHDPRGNRKAYRIAQTGFAWCSVYTSDRCEAGTEIPAVWRGGKYRRAKIEEGEPQTRILPGSNWYLSEDENVLIGSWRCEYQ